MFQFSPRILRVKYHFAEELFILPSSTFNFSVPELSWLTACLLLVACLVLHYVPIRVLLLLWGLIKFSRRIIRPHSVPNNEVLDLLSRVPDDEEIVRKIIRTAKYPSDNFLSRFRSCGERCHSTRRPKWLGEIQGRKTKPRNATKSPWSGTLGRTCGRL